MRDVLLLADLHGEFGKIGSFLDLSPDAIIIAGDLTNMGPADAVKSLFEWIDVPAFAVPGNCDPRETVDALESPTASASTVPRSAWETFPSWESGGPTRHRSPRRSR